MLRAWLVHLLTATGAVWALLALRAIAEGRVRAALGWMAVAVAVDAVDGPLARTFDVKRHASPVDGALLDNLMDYLNYAVVPAVLIAEAGLLPPRAAPAAAAAICIAAAFQFVHRAAKTADHFRGFPSYWNVVAVYLLLLRPAPWTSLLVVAALCGLSVVPLRFVYPSRTPRLRGLTLVLSVLWGAAMMVLLVEYPDGPRGLVYGSLLYPAYYALLSLRLTFAPRAPLL